jgi:4-aminobutyrate aminotransferase-like enzyme
MDGTSELGGPAVAGAIVREVERRCLQDGVLALHCGPSGQVLRLLPPLTIERQDLERALAVLDRAFSAVERSLACQPRPGQGRGATH